MHRPVWLHNSQSVASANFNIDAVSHVTPHEVGDCSTTRRESLALKFFSDLMKPSSSAEMHCYSLPPARDIAFGVQIDAHSIRPALRHGSTSIRPAAHSSRV